MNARFAQSSKPYNAAAALSLLVLLLLALPAHARDTLATDIDSGTSAVTLRSAVFSDAATRSSLVNLEPGTAGYSSGFYIESGDENFQLKAKAIIQFRYMATLEADRADTGSSETGFQFRRTRLDIRGRIATERLTFRMQVDFDRSDGVFELTDAYFDYDLGDGLGIRVGQGNLPFDREQNFTSMTTLPHLERSIVNDIFEVERAQQIQLSYETDRVRVYGAVSDGARSLNTAFAGSEEADMAFTGRAMVRLGEASWSQWRDFQGFQGDKPGVLIGAGAHWQDDGLTFSETGGGQLLAYTFDIGYEDSGWNVAAIFNGRSIDDNALGTLNDYGFVLQGGVFVTEQIEVAARAAWVLPSDDRTEPSDTFSAYTGTVSWFATPGSHMFKIIAEVTVYPDTQADSSSIVGTSSARAQLSDNSGGQVALGLGVQMRF
jgi:hypothetical protein